MQSAWLQGLKRLLAKINGCIMIGGLCDATQSHTTATPVFGPTKQLGPASSQAQNQIKKQHGTGAMDHRALLLTGAGN